MLDLITKSKIRKKILLLFFYNQNKEFYLREIAKTANTSPGTAKREIERLAKQDLVTMTKKANLSLYKLNQKNKLIPYLEGIIKNTVGIEIVLKDLLKNRKDVEFAFIFGSYAKNEFTSDSDIDLYIIGDINGKNTYSITQKAEDEIHRPVNYHLASRKEFQNNLKNDFFHKEITKKYILLTDNSSEFRKIIK